MSPRAPALALCLLFACSGPADPPAAAAPAAPVAAKTVTPPTVTPAPPDDGRVSLLPAVNSPAPAKEPPLTQEEIDLLAADPATLTPELRRKRAFALRRKILQNPDSPTARQLEALRLAYERGELQPQLPDSSGGKKTDNGLVLQARPTPKPATEPAPTEPAKTEPAKTEPAKTEPAKTEPAKTP
jgi:hypothetical protein